MAVLLFDLDDTLYRSPSLRAARDEAIIAAVARAQGTGIAEARRQLAAARASAGTTTSALSRLGVSRQGFWDTLASVDPAGHVRPDDSLQLLLRRLCQWHQLAVLTNSPRSAASRVLATLGIDGYFSAVIGADDVPAPKPAAEAFLAAARALAVDPRQCVMIGNTAEKDIVPARALGMRTVLLGGSDSRADFRIAELADIERLPL
jgi:HAD superfamily hydrolase (TIGR01549 family)